MNLSIVVPIYNEEKNIPILVERLCEVLDQTKETYEVICVNDGSKDDSFEVLRMICQANSNIKAINFKRNFGQTSAINAGIQYSTGEIVILIDSDLENDPKDIPTLLTKLDEGYDVVSGWRQKRWTGNYLTRKLPSMLANKLISKISGVALHDYGCTLKAYRREVIKDVLLYGQMHRFIPVYCSWQGGKVTEVPVNYAPRLHGQSNYGLFRTYRVILDLILIKFLDKYMQNPIHFFGGTGFLSFCISGLSFIVALYYKFSGQKDFVQSPLIIISLIFLLIGVLMILMGIVAEILVRTYFESQNKFPFTVKEKINFNVPIEKES